jgi:hypothetical protein
MCKISGFNFADINHPESGTNAKRSDILTVASLVSELRKLSFCLIMGNKTSEPKRQSSYDAVQQDLYPDDEETKIPDRLGLICEAKEVC